MFNRQPFNRGGFNRSAAPSSDIYGQSVFNLDSNAKVTRTLSAIGAASLVMKSSLDGVSAIYGVGTSTMCLNTLALPTSFIFATPGMSSINMASYADHTLGGEEVILLNNINLPPGGELIINTCDMTVMVNGVNGLEYVDASSDFFKFLTGRNELVYSDTGARREVTIDILWKDRWV